ncbi:MAG: hypothetical protein MUC50_05480 [Myxococcota bacterium]|nr:hypothetical protein [Myxococcota bacterium]
MSEVEKYRAMLEKDPTDIQAFVNLCRFAEREGDYHYLAELYMYRAQVVRDQQEIGDLYYKASELYLDKLGETTAGVEALLAGFEHDRTHAGIGDRLDSIYRGAEDWEAALQVLEQRIEALEETDVHGTQTALRSDLYQQAGEIWDKVFNEQERALAEYRKAIELDKSNVLALYGAREIYYAAGQFRNAAKLCELEARSEKDPERRMALYRELGHILSAHLNDPVQAVLAIKRAMKINPDDRETKSDLAEIIALTPIDEETEKDHQWASEYLLRLASKADLDEAQRLLCTAFIAMPTNSRVLSSLESYSVTSAEPEAVCEFYKSILEAVPQITDAAPLVRIQAHHCLDRLGRPDEAMEWMKKLAGLDDPGDAEFIAHLVLVLDTREYPVKSSQPPQSPPAVAADGAPFQSRAKSRASTYSKEGEDSWSGLPAAPVLEEEGEGGESDGAMMSISNPPDAEDFEPNRHSSAPPSSLRRTTSRPPVDFSPPTGMSIEAWVAELHLQADAARRRGDDVTAEERMLSVLEVSPYDQKATSFLERRFRSRSDWAALRDVLMRAAGSPHLPAAVQTVRLREAARLSEEQLADVNGAIAAWQAIHENDPKVRDAMDALVRLLAEANRWIELLEVVREEAQSTKSKTKSIECYHRIADIYRVRICDIGAAASAYAQVLELAPEDLPAMEALDEIYVLQQRWPELVQLLRRRAELARDRGSKRDFLSRAAHILEERMESHEEAYSLAGEILAFAPRDDETLELMERIDAAGAKWERLLAVLDMRVQAIDDPALKTEKLRRKAHVAAVELSDTRVAIKAWREVLSLIPGDQIALESLAEIYKNSGDYRELVSVWRDSIPFAQSDLAKADLYRQMARVFESELSAADEAMECWRKVLEIDEDVESLGALSRYYERMGDWSELVEVLGRQAPYAETNGQRADILYKRAMLLAERLGDRDQAERDLGQIISSVDPSHTATLELLRRIYVETDRYDKAVETLEQQISFTEDPFSKAALLVQLGDWCRQQLKDLPRAMDAFEKAGVLRPEVPEVLDTLEEIYVELSEWDRQLKLVYGRSKLAEDPQEKLTLLMRGAQVCEERLSDAQKAWTWYREIFDALWQISGILDLVVEAATRHGLWRELIDVYVVMAGRASDEGEQLSLWLKVADIFEGELNDAAAALEAVLRSFGLRPDEAELLDRVDRLAVASSSWPRLATVYGVLVKRAADAPSRIALLTRYAKVLLDPGQQAGAAFDVSLKAFEIDPHSEELLAFVEQMAEASERWADMVMVYGVCGRLSSDRSRKADLALRAYGVFKHRLSDSDGAMAALVEAMLANPFSDTNVEHVWDGVAALEAAQPPQIQGVYWIRLVETYRRLIDEHKNDRSRKVDLLVATARIYLERVKAYREGFNCLKEAHFLNAKDEDTIARLEETARDNDLWKELTDHYQDLLDETFEMRVATMLHRRRARILEEVLGRPAEAAEHYWQIIQLDATDYAGFEKLLSYYERAGKWNELVNLLERQLDLTLDDDDKRRVLQRIAQVWEYKIGNRFEAKDWYEQILLLCPGDAEAEAALERVGGGKARVGISEPLEDDEQDELRELISIPAPPMSALPSRPPEVAPAEDASGLDGHTEPGLGVVMAQVRMVQPSQDRQKESSPEPEAQPAHAADALDAQRTSEPGEEDDPEDDSDEDDSDEDDSDEDDSDEDDSDEDDSDEDSEEEESLQPEDLEEGETLLSPEDLGIASPPPEQKKP